MIAVAISLVLPQVLVQSRGKLASEGVVDQRHPEVVRVTARQGGVDPAYDRLGRAGPVHQVDRGALHQVGLRGGV